jgi:dTDP-4-amino-4,6-dideoxygalactose transaminase
MLDFYANKYNLKPEDYPGAQASNDYSMAIPLHNLMTAEDYQYVVQVIKSIK